MKCFICPECNTELQDNVSVCPKCGYPIKKENNTLMIVIGVMALIIAWAGILDGFVYLCTWFDSLMDLGIFSKYTLGYFLCFIECVMITIGFASTGLIFLFNKKREYLKISILLIAGTYVLFTIVCLLFAVNLFNIRVILRIMTALARMIIWGSIVYYSNSIMNMSKKSAKQCVTICIAVIILIELFITRNLDTLAEVLKYSILLLFVWYNPFVTMDGIQETTVNMNRSVWSGEKVNTYVTDIRKSEGHIEVWKVLLFSIFTFGIYSLIWIYRTVNLFNEKNIGEKRSAGVQVALCALVPFYGIYWIYKQSKLTEEYSNNVGNKCSDLPMLSLILSIFGLSLIAMMLVQEQINKNLLSENSGEIEQCTFNVVHKASENEAQTKEKLTTVKQESAKTDRMSNDEISYLIKMKELKDAGILSDEEYAKERNKVLNK